MKYSEQVLTYFYNTNHAGLLDVNDPAVLFSKVGSADNGDLLELYVQCRRNVVMKASFRAYGSVAMIAAGEFICRWLQGKKLDEMVSLTHDKVLQALDLSIIKIHIATLVCSAIMKIVTLQQSSKDRVSENVV